MRSAEIGRPRELVYQYSTSQVLDSGYIITVKSGASQRERKTRILHGFMRMILGDLESSCTAPLGTRKKSNVELNLFHIHAFYYSDICKGKDVSWIRYARSVRRQCVRCLSKLEDIPQQRCISAGTMADTCPARARSEDLMSSLAHSGSNATIEERTTRRIIGKEALRKMSLSERRSFIEGLQLVQEDLITSA